MARSRSPSPRRSRHNYSSSRSDHHNQRESNHTSRRRSPSEDRRRHRRGDHGRGDRDRNLERSRERYNDHEGSRRPHSRDDGRLRENSPVRDRRRDRDSYRDDRDDNDRDRKRYKRDDASPRRHRRDDGRDRQRSFSSRNREAQKFIDARATAEDTRLVKELQAQEATAKADEERKAKLAKVQAWKEKMEKKRAAADQTGAAASPGSVTSPPAASPGNMSQSATTSSSPAPPTDKVKPMSPAPYAGKFDPNAIRKRAAAAMNKSKLALGGDVVIPKSATDTSNANSTQPADNSKVASSGGVNGTLKPSAADTRITGFGLNKASADRLQESNVLSTKATAAPLDEEEEVERKLEKLPDMPMQIDTGDSALANLPDQQQDEGDDIRSDEEEAEAAREAAQRRAEEMQAEDTDMTDSKDVIIETEAAENPSQSKVSWGTPQLTSNASKMEVDTEDVDPLDAFMNDLEKPEDTAMPNLAIGRGKKGQKQMFNNDDEEADLDAIGEDTDDIFAMAAKRKKKEIPTVDHSKMQYDSFRKEFYSESVELAGLTPDEVDVMRAELENIKTRGINVPKPIMKWSQGGFGSQILDVIREQKFEKPTSIQSQALPAIMAGRDVIGVAKTGSGKTVAFILPMFRHIKDQRPVESLDGPIGLILAPTRELATQIHRDCKPYLKALNLRAVCAYGGAPIKDQIAELKRGAEIVVCTPGRFIDLLAANAGRVTNLQRVTYVVLDEADRMFDMGFEPQITKVLSNIRPERQTVLFSATFPRSMEALARKALHKPIEITVGGRSVVAPEITQVIEVRSEGSKFNRLLGLIGDLHDKDEDARSLIFVERQETADDLLKQLMNRGYPCITIHGGREQIDRDQAIIDFKAGIFPIMVATSVAARGLDVKQLKLVVNFDCPNHGEDYVHRCGRTGRAGNTGTAVTFVTPEQDRFAPFLLKALVDSNQEVSEDLQKLKEAHEESVKAGKAKKIGSGFGGKGIERFEAARDAERAVQRKQYKTGDEPEEDEEKDVKKDDAQSKAESMIAKATGGVKDRDAQRDSPEPQPALPSTLADHLNNAMKVQKAEIAPPPARSNNTLAAVSEAAAKINSRLGAKGAARPGVPIDNRGPDAGAFHATLEINDFPQKARWGVTNRTNVAKILEATGTSITNKGNYYEPPNVPGPGDVPKLYILVEGDTEVAVENAMRELTRLLKEGTIEALSKENAKPVGGRYSVV